MTLAVLLASSSQCHSLIQGHIIADNGSLTNDDTVAVINEKSLADLRAGMDLDAGLTYTTGKYIWPRNNARSHIACRLDR